MSMDLRKSIGTIVPLCLALNSCTNFQYLNLGELGDDAFRMRQPSYGVLEKLHEKRDFKSILNLRGAYIGEKWYDKELRFSEKNNLSLVSIELKREEYPSKEKILEIIDYLETSDKPLLIHCQGGADRTGLVSAMYGLVILDEPVRKAKKRLSFWRGHIKSYAIDEVIEGFEDSKYSCFKTWIQEEYNLSND